MSGMTGIETAQKLRAILKDVIIIFISSSDEFYPQAYDVFAFNYLMKPLNREKLYRVLDTAFGDMHRGGQQKISISYKSTVYSVDCREILYLESQDKIILFHMQDKSEYKCYGRLDDILKLLPFDQFIRCHQSYAVNRLHINEMGENHFRIGKVGISISKKHIKHAKENYLAYLFQTMQREKPI
jgi:DNA-binding LytR/AlgR family response regulator